MNGKLGSLHQGRLQVGGILDWTVEVALDKQSKDTATYYKLSLWRLTAKAYWLYDVTDNVIVRLYGEKGYWEGVGEIVSTPRKVFDTLIHEPLEIMGRGVLEGKE